ncbi:hypothetical protein QBC34DRAFT_392400 [Podospora aff. communis PSN243]|uniref:Uncharacterized protein n=1 Tax=Podospora aff. communis PSN243 TaxID=3040156 RepID=A0AAV9H1Z8_9PEZI|nr:hypothetical protein QBC34DRAFT_392400 [Podospora aff. communis PSN243]
MPQVALLRQPTADPELLPHAPIIFSHCQRLALQCPPPRVSSSAIATHVGLSDHQYNQRSMELATLHHHKIFSTPSPRKETANSSRTTLTCDHRQLGLHQIPSALYQRVVTRVESNHKETSPQPHLNSFLQPSRTRFSQQWRYCLKESSHPPRWPWVTTRLRQQPTVPHWQLQLQTQNTSNTTSQAITHISTTFQCQNGTTCQTQSNTSTARDAGVTCPRDTPATEVARDPVARRGGASGCLRIRLR